MSKGSGEVRQEGRAIQPRERAIPVRNWVTVSQEGTAETAQSLSQGDPSGVRGWGISVYVLSSVTGGG